MPDRSTRRRPRAVVMLTAIVAMAALAGCSGEGAAGESGGAPTSAVGAASTSAPAPTVPRPPGPQADISQRLEGGNGVLLAAAAAGPDLGAAGWVEEEYVAAGTAASQRAAGELPTDGRFELTDGPTATYRTRIVVRRPQQADRFDGTVVLEWLNVSGGFDANPDYSFMADELLRRGAVWVGVSAQRIGIEGGPVAVGVTAGEGLAGKGLKALDPSRYGSLQHPGDAFAYDIVTQVARALRSGGGPVLGGLTPERILAVGESQSAFALTTYADGVQPRTSAFDGFLIHSRGGAAAPLGEPGGYIDIASAIAGRPTIVRTDLDVPVLILETETDLVSLLNYLPARQDDTERIRLWEVAGTAHADRFLLGPLADSVGCATAVNDGPQQFVARAALAALDDWVRTGVAPAEAPRLDTAPGPDGRPMIVRDAVGNAVGGIRLPQVEAPVATLSGEPGAGGSVICLLLGSTVPLDPARLTALHGDRSRYLAAYEAATDAAIRSGFALEADRAALLADAEPDRVPG